MFETQRMEPMIRRRRGDDVEDGREEEDGVGGEGDVEDGNVGREEVEDSGGSVALILVLQGYRGLF